MQPNEILLFFAKFIESELGIVYAEHNYFQLQNRLDDIAKSLGVPSLEKLYEKAQSGINGTFKQLLLDVATNNETSFFRDLKVFKAIESQILPEAQKTARLSLPFEVWSAASSTGQEALTVAMLIKEWGLKSATPLPFKIMGTDISTRALARCKAASYSQLEVQRGLPAPLLIKYFTKDPQDRWNAKTELTQHLQFQPLNLKESFDFKGRFDLILCRNVLIYQSVEGKREILKKITASLKPGGYLILGAGESLLGLSEEYQQTPVEGAVLYRRKNASAIQAA